MTQSRLSGDTIAVVISGNDDAGILRWYADLIGGHRNSRVHLVRAAASSNGTSVCDTLRTLARAGDLGFVIASLAGETDRVGALFELATEMDVPVLFVRQAPGRRIRRVLVASAGGPHTLQQLWVAREIGAALDAPLRVIRVARDNEDRKNGLPPAVAAAAVADTMDRWTPRILGIRDRELSEPTAGFAKAIAGQVRPDDLLVMGAPSSLYAGRLDECIPASVANRTDAPFIVMKAKRAEGVTLRSLFWGGLILPGLYPTDREAAIAALVDALVRHSQVPKSCKASVVRRALRRERISSTAVGLETAFPHVRLPGFHGVAGSMAICPDGVDFGAEDGSATRFVYLLISSEGFCDEHLATVAKIARRMIRPEVRAALLGCTMPSEVLGVLEPAGVAVAAEVDG